MNDSSDISGELALTPVNQCTKTVWKSLVAASDYYILLRIRSSLLLIIYLVLMCNNDVIMSIYYYGFLRIIDLCAKMEAKTQRQTVSIRVATF